MSEILCLSGGVDSVVAWHYLRKPMAVYFDTGLPFCKKELKTVKSLVKNVHVDTSLNFSKEQDIHIAHRNLLFASRASNYADIVYIAGLKDDMVEDKTPEAFKLMSNVLSSCGKIPVSVRSPFWKMTKTEVVKWFVDHVEDAEYILNNLSVSCYAGGDEPCGQCESCYRKSCAMFNAGIPPAEFNNMIMVMDYAFAAQNGKFINERNQDVLNYAEFMSVI